MENGNIETVLSKYIRDNYFLLKFQRKLDNIFFDNYVFKNIFFGKYKSEPIFSSNKIIKLLNFKSIYNQTEIQ